MLKYLSLTAIVVTFCAYATPLLAQLPTKPGPPPLSNNVAAWIIISGLIVFVVMTSVKNAKRDEQD